MKFFLGGEYIGFSLSVCLSVCPPSVDMILSRHVLRNGCMIYCMLKLNNIYVPYILSMVNVWIFQFFLGGGGGIICYIYHIEGPRWGY